jgi:hypothetical protein
MLGIHNFYKGEDKALDDIVKTIYTIEHNEVLENGTRKIENLSPTTPSKSHTL